MQRVAASLSARVSCLASTWRSAPVTSSTPRQTIFTAHFIHENTFAVNAVTQYESNTSAERCAAWWIVHCRQTATLLDINRCDVAMDTWYCDPVSSFSFRLYSPICGWILIVIDFVAMTFMLYSLCVRIYDHFVRFELLIFAHRRVKWAHLILSKL